MGDAGWQGRRGGPVATGATLALALLLPLAGVGCSRRPPGREVLARVAGSPVTLDEFRRQWQRQRLPADETGAPPPQSAETQRRALLADIINRRLLLQEAQRAQIWVSFEDVDTALGQLRSGWGEDWALALKHQQLTAVELKISLREAMMVRKYLRDFVFARVAVTDADVQNYARTHPERLEIPERVRARQILLASRGQAESLRAALLAGASFEELASKHSLAANARQGGDLGWVARADLPAALAAACFSQPLNRLGPTVETDYGFFIFWISERRPAGQQSFAQGRDALELALRQELEREAQAQLLHTLWAQGKVSIKEGRLAPALL